MTKRYVAGFMRIADTNNVLLVRKLFPEWQRGLLNGIGGKIEQGETTLAAMRREWREETSSEQEDWQYVAELTGPGYRVYFFACTAAALPTLPDEANDVGEKFELIDCAHLVERVDLIANLRWLIPMAFFDRARPFARVFDRGCDGEADHA